MCLCHNGEVLARKLFNFLTLKLNTNDANIDKRLAQGAGLFFYGIGLKAKKSCKNLFKNLSKIFFF